MSQSSEQTLPAWLPRQGLREKSPSASRSWSQVRLSDIKRDHSRVYRLCLLCGVLFSTGLHLVLLFGFNRATAPAVDVSKALRRPPAEAFLIPLEEPEPAETSQEVTQTTQAFDVGRPSLPDPITVPVATDFTISPAPVSPVSTLIDSSLLRIPESVGRSTELSRQRVFNLAELDHQPELVQSMNPVYPPELQGTNVYGIVVVHFIISAQGEIIRPEIVSTPHPALGAAVTRALARWRFKAGMKAGRAVSTAMELPVRFNLE